MQNNDEDPITIQWRGSLRLFAHTHIYIHTYTHIHILTYIYIYTYIYTYTYVLHAMYSNRLFWAPVNCAARNPTAKSRGSREPRDQTCILIVSKSDRQLGRAAAVMPVQSQSDWKKSKTRISQPRDPTKSRGRTTVRPAEKGPDELRVEMSAKANLPLAQTPPPTWSDTRNTM